MTKPKEAKPLSAAFVDRVDLLYKSGNSIENCAFEVGCGCIKAKAALVQAGTPLRSRGDSIRLSKQIRGVCRQVSTRSDLA